MIPLLLLLAGADDAMETYRARTAAEHRCVVTPDTTDITVCGKRHADRFRVPFVGGPNGNRTDDVPYEREALLHRTTPIDDLSPFLVGGGMAGVSVSTRGGVGGYKARELAK
ncbi:hypothetical protein [uncultured Sphingomonas sp.]|uniref:hypothetical protein n=1 Tax=uncultured Sphingomonas sp. TaxID=158754 RepID=UPI0025F01469|nr:hypothetical protein [uncultured Sphingomonas sp.]